MRQAENLKSEFTTLESDSKASETQIQTTAHDEKEIERRIAKVKRAIEEELVGFKQERELLAATESRLEHDKSGLMQLEVDVQKVESQKTPPQKLEHRLTPLSRMIQGKELHYQLLNNRVAYLPIQELMERMRLGITEKRSRLFRDGAQRGDVGPVAGFRMDYLVRVKRLSTIDELREGSSMTIELSKWQLNPEPDLDSEGIEEALNPGSDFLRYLRGADAETTITLWVYPDSFEIYRKLQEFAHRENFTVAADRCRWGFRLPARRKVRDRQDSDLQLTPSGDVGLIRSPRTTEIPISPSFMRGVDVSRAVKRARSEFLTRVHVVNPIDGGLLHRDVPAVDAQFDPAALHDRACVEYVIV